MGLSFPYPPNSVKLTIGRDGAQYIEIGYYFAHLMLHAQALKFLEENKTGSTSGSPARSPTDLGTLELKKQHMSAISQLSTQILQRARRVEVTEIRVMHLKRAN
jgi:hypothetical protein